ncbi:MAG: NAD(P)H-hydrate dehydratase [Planctomycetes bacterium]|nr:NAD(P)H-hydrate dehydratase [Planctomycetota bacterium]
MRTVSDVARLPVRETDSHKGTFGKVCVIGGQVGMSGAPALSGMAALRSGAGLVRVAVGKSILNVVASFDPCYTTIALADNENGEVSETAVGCVMELCKDNDVIAAGPGLGTGRGARRIVNSLIEIQGLRLVVDADGLNCLAKENGWHERKKASVILTPHPGEMGRIWKSVFRKDMPAGRNDQAVMLAEETGCTVVLKGAQTVVADSEKVYVNTTGNAGMATAGSGDVLTGVIAGIAGQGLCDFDAAQLGVYIHGLAGDIAAEKYGQISLTAKDILKKLPKAFMRIV